MLATVFHKTVRDHVRGWAIATVAIWAVLLLGMFAYSGLDMDLFEALPEAYRSIVGLRPGMDVGAFAISAIYGVYAALTWASIALSMGAASIAGEESNGTLGLLLANPRSRTHVVVSKALALVLLGTVATLVSWAATIGAAAVQGIALGDLDLLAISVHGLASMSFYGLLALAVSAATGKRGTASGVSVGVLVAGFLGTGLLPLLEGGAGWARLFPWYYYNGHEPLYNGIHWGDVGVLVAASAALVVVAVVGFARRDLTGQSVGVTWVDRLRANPLTRKLTDRLAGTARVSSIWVKTASEHQMGLLLACAYLFFIQLILGPLYNAIPADAFSALADLPDGLEALFAFFGGGDMSTAAGWLQIETFGMMAPIMIMVTTISIGAAAIAGEESKRTMGLLLANPIRRSHVIAQKAWTMVLYGSIAGFALFAGTALGSALGNLGLPLGNIAAASILATLVGIVGGALALALGAGSGRKGTATFGAIGVMAGMHVLNSLGEVSASMAGAAKLSPFHYYLGGDPLNAGLDWTHAVVLAAIAVVLIGLSFPLFQRRDVRERD